MSHNSQQHQPSQWLAQNPQLEETEMDAPDNQANGYTLPEFHGGLLIETEETNGLVVEPPSEHQHMFVNYVPEYGPQSGSIDQGLLFQNCGVEDGDGNNCGESASAPWAASTALDDEEMVDLGSHIEDGGF